MRTTQGRGGGGACKRGRPCNEAPHPRTPTVLGGGGGPDIATSNNGGAGPVRAKLRAEGAGPEFVASMAGGQGAGRATPAIGEVGPARAGCRGSGGGPKAAMPCAEVWAPESVEPAMTHVPVIARPQGEDGLPSCARDLRGARAHCVCFKAVMSSEDRASPDFRKF